MNDFAKKRNSGQMFVGMVLLIGSVIAIVSLLLLFISGSIVNASYGIRAQAIAQAAAQAGAQDALLRLDRNAFNSLPATYSLSVASATATVYVAANTPSSGFYTVTSTATVAFHTKTIQVVLSTASTTQLNVVSWQVVR